MNPAAVHSILERVQAEDDEGVEDHSLEEEEEEGAAHSLKDVCDFGKAEPSPFSSRRVMYENEEVSYGYGAHQITSAFRVVQVCIQAWGNFWQRWGSAKQKRWFAYLTLPREQAVMMSSVSLMFWLQMVIPGDVTEMTEFQEKTMSNSRFIVELCLPNVQLSFPSKAFYETLHNRYKHLKISMFINYFHFEI